MTLVVTTQAAQELLALMAGHGLKRGEHLPAKPGRKSITADEGVPLAPLTAGSTVDDVITHQRERARKDKANRNQAKRKAREERDDYIDSLADDTPMPEGGSLQTAWDVVAPLFPIIERVVNAKCNWASRLSLGNHIADDITQDVVTDVLKIVVGSSHDMGELAESAESLQCGSDYEGDPVLRKFLMQVVNRRANFRLADVYRDSNRDVTDAVLTTIMAGVDDPAMVAFHAARPPRRSSAAEQGPGQIDMNVLAAAVAIAITEHGLDPLVDVMLDDAHLRVDGSMRWTEYAEDVLSAVDPDMWGLVVGAVPNRVDRGAVAKVLVRRKFEWLPALICEVAEALQPDGRTHTLGDALRVVGDDGEG